MIQSGKKRLFLFFPRSTVDPSFFEFKSKIRKDTGIMKIEYKFVTGEKVRIDVTGELEAIMLEFDKELKNNSRKETRRHESLSLFDKDEKITDITVDILGDVCRNFDKGKLYSAIAKMKPHEKDLIYKLYLSKNFMTQAEYAKILGITENAVQKRTAKIKAKLKKLLQLHTYQYELQSDNL